MIISIFASIGQKNLGDELILRNEIRILENQYGKNTKFIVFSYDYKNPFFKQDNIRYVEYFPVGIKNYKNILKNIFNFFVFLFWIIKSDLVVIGGGGIIYDNEVQSTKSPLDLWNYRMIFFRFLKKNVDFFRIGLNIKNKENYNKLKSIFKGSQSISVRDEYSLNLLNKIGIRSILKKDPVFFDNGELHKEKYLIGRVSSYDFGVNSLSKFDFDNIIVGIALRSGYLTEKSNFSERLEEGKIKEIINKIVLDGGKVILLPHSFHQTDRLANDYLFLKKFVDNKNVVIKKTMKEVYDVYKNRKIDICFSMRLHSIILSHIYKIPFVGISYSTKTDEILEQLKNTK